MGLRFKASVEGHEVFDRAFNRLTERVEDLRDVWPAVGEWFFEMERALFASEGASGGEAWPPLTPRYQEWKDRHALFMPLMRFSDATYQALTKKGSPHQVFEPKPREFAIGTSLPYPAMHMRRYKTRPARKLIQVTDKDRLALQKAIQRPLVAFARAQGLMPGPRRRTLVVSSLAEAMEIG